MLLARKLNAKYQNYCERNKRFLEKIPLLQPTIETLKIHERGSLVIIIIGIAVEADLAFIRQRKSKA